MRGEDKDRALIQRGLRLLGIGSGLRGDLETAALSLALGSIAKEQDSRPWWETEGVKCQECGWVNTWRKICRNQEFGLELQRTSKKTNYEAWAALKSY
jgi:hypothetical protein